MRADPTNDAAAMPATRSSRLVISLSTTFALARRGRRRKRLSREQLIAVGGIVGKRRNHDRILNHVFRLDAFVHIHAGVMCARIVLNGILDELEARQSDGIEILMIGPAGAARSQRGHAEFPEWLHPLFKHGPRTL